MGEAIGSGVVPFNNLQIEKIPDELYKSFDNIRNAVDFGYATDPLALYVGTMTRRNVLSTQLMNTMVYK